MLESTSFGFLAKVSASSSRIMLEIEIEQRREHAGVADVLHQDARAQRRRSSRCRACASGTPRIVMSSRLKQRRARPGGVVEQVAARRNLAHVARIGLGIHRDHEVDAARARHVAVARHADLVPGRQALDVGREVVLAHHRDALRKIDFISSVLALAEPVPLTLAILIDEIVDAVLHAVSSMEAYCLPWRTSAACGQRIVGLLHVPGGRRAALGAQAAVHAEVLVLDHDAAGLLQRRRTRTAAWRDIVGRRLEAAAQFRFRRRSASSSGNRPDRCRCRHRTRCTAWPRTPSARRSSGSAALRRRPARR